MGIYTNRFSKSLNRALRGILCCNAAFLFLLNLMDDCVSQYVNSCVKHKHEKVIVKNVHVCIYVWCFLNPGKHHCNVNGLSLIK